MNPLVSIIVPIYKVEEYLDECVESIVNQTYSDIEIILVDDGSPDKCPRLCDEWAKKDDRIKVIHKENGGVSSARNAGINIAKGEWIWFVDSDDSVEKDALEELSEYFNAADLIAFNAKIDKLYTKDEKFFDSYYFRYQFGFEPWNKLYKKSIIVDNDLRFDTEETVGEDLLFNITYYQYADKYKFSTSKYYNFAYNFNFSKSIFYNYRVVYFSAFMSNNEKRLEQQLRLYSKIYDIYKNKLDERILVQLFIMHLISGINQTGKSKIGKSNCKLITNSLKKYNFSKKTLNLAIENFLNCENASFLGKIRIKIFFTLLHISVKLAIMVI
ncbi:MAG: glycosyltransferase family 2 protein [Clostridia bacterium]|nr:glycosyltransferase family 2 protein [Clostridia bacterium]